jgi:hypothetical protein
VPENNNYEERLFLHSTLGRRSSFFQRLDESNPEYPLKPKGKVKIVRVLFLTEHHAMKAYWGVDF